MEMITSTLSNLSCYGETFIIYVKALGKLLSMCKVLLVPVTLSSLGMLPGTSGKAITFYSSKMSHPNKLAVLLILDTRIGQFALLKATQ